MKGSCLRDEPAGQGVDTLTRAAESYDTDLCRLHRHRHGRHARVPAGELVDLAPQLFAAAGVEPDPKQRRPLGASDPELEEVGVVEAAFPEIRLEPPGAPDQLRGRRERCAAASSLLPPLDSELLGQRAELRAVAPPRPLEPLPSAAAVLDVGGDGHHGREEREEQHRGELRPEVERNAERERDQRRTEREP